MFSKKFYIVATTTRVRDVNIEHVYDGDVFTLNTILSGVKKSLQEQTIQCTVFKDEDSAFIDVLGEDGELKQTYSIVGKQAFVSKPY